MNRIRNLNLFQKGILSVMIVMVLVFSVIYPITISRVGFAYKDSILVPITTNGNTMYSGKLMGKQAVFTVTKDNTVIFKYGDKLYGTYNAIEDPTAIPKKEDFAGDMTGVEVRKDDKILFRGGILNLGDVYWLYNEDGTLDNLGFSYTTNDGIERDKNGNIIDPAEPSPLTIWELLNKPEMTHKGQGFAWFEAVFICILNGLSILFADELFRWHLSFRIRDANYAEPSDLEIAGRYIGWTVITVIALVIFIMGLQ